MSNLFKISIFGQNHPLKTSRVASFGYFDFDEPSDPTITDLPKRMLDLLVEQFEKSDNLLSFYGILLNPGQDIENTLGDINKLKNISNAAGDQLDLAGALIGENRSSKGDVEYRSSVYSKIHLNNSSGEPEIIIQTLKMLTKSFRVIYLEIYPAGILLTFYTPYIIPPLLKKNIERVALAGVKITLQYINSEDRLFGFESEAGIILQEYTLGFSEDSYKESGKEIGGIISELLDQ